MYPSREDMGKVREEFNKVFSIQDIVDLLEGLERGNEQRGFTKIKESVIKFFDNTKIDVVNSSTFIDSVNICQCMVIAFPRIFHLCRLSLIFSLKNLFHLKLQNFNQLEGLDDDVKRLILKINSTILTACYTILLENKSRVIGNREWMIPDFPDSMKGTLDKGAWLEFMEYISDKEGIIQPSFENCIIC